MIIVLWLGYLFCAVGGGALLLALLVTGNYETFQGATIALVAGFALIKYAEYKIIVDGIQ